MTLDKDLQSIQEVRNLVASAKKASEILSGFTQEQLDKICKAIAAVCMENNERLAKMAEEETGFGKWQDKMLKNQLGSAITWDYVKDMKVVGFLGENKETGVCEVGVPMGVVAALIPSTNPTSTTMYKTIISIKAGNAIVISPHPGAKNAILETYRIMKEAAMKAGAPEGTINCITMTTMQATDTLLKNPDVNIILATGGEAMVHAAYSSGNPALGVGPGNGPCFIEHTADIAVAIRKVMDSKTFDNGTICASEQSIVTEQCIADDVRMELERQGAYFLTEAQSDQLSSYMLRANGTMNPKIVGRTAQKIADMAGIQIPSGTRVMVSCQKEETIGKKNPYSREKLCPILGFYVVGSWEEACETSMKLLKNEGAGHTMTMHTKDQEIVKAFALSKPVSRILVNTLGSLGGVGATTGLAPALTLGCGAVGGSATSDNISPLNLRNIRRIAYGIKDLGDLRAQAPAVEGSVTSGFAAGAEISEADVEAITKAVLRRLQAARG